MGSMKKKRLLLTVVLAGLVLIGLLTGLTLNRLDNNRRFWQESLTRQGAFILASFRAVGRAGMRHQRSFPLRRLQYLAEELRETGLCETVYIIDHQGRIIIHSNPQQVGGIDPEAALRWDQVRPDSGYLAEGRFEETAFRMVRPLRGPRWRLQAPPGVPEPFSQFFSDQNQFFLGVVDLPLKEYQAARRAEIRQALGLAVGVFGAALALIVVLLFFHDRRTLKQLQFTTGLLIEEMPAGLVAADEKGRVLTVNQAAREIWGLAPKDELKVRLKEILDPVLNRSISSLDPGRTLTEVETRLEVGNQAEPIPVALSAVRVAPSAEEPTAFILLIRDLRAYQELEERLRRSERLAALGRLSAGVAHEIRNPLSSIRGLAQYLQSKLPEGSDEAGYAEVMIGEADRLNRVVSDLLAYASPRPIKTGPTELNEVVEKVAGLLAEQASQAGVELVKNLDPDLGRLNLDRDQITQVVLNLVINGLESGGRRVVLTTGREADRASLRVADDGPGVAPEERPRIFDPFVTTKAQGSGLGLAISLRIAEEHGGSLSLRDSEKGALFELTLPAGEVEPDPQPVEVEE